MVVVVVPGSGLAREVHVWETEAESGHEQVCDDAPDGDRGPDAQDEGGGGGGGGGEDECVLREGLGGAEVGLLPLTCGGRLIRVEATGIGCQGEHTDADEDLGHDTGLDSIVRSWSLCHVTVSALSTKSNSRSLTRERPKQIHQLLTLILRERRSRWLVRVRQKRV